MKKRNWILIGAGVVIICLFMLISWHPRAHFSSTTYSKIDIQEKVLVLTFDDGPGEETGKILDVLTEKNVSAVFFVVGERLAWYPNETTRILAEGHEIGIHGHSHKFSLFGEVNELILGKEVIERKTGLTQYYRPPYGYRTLLLNTYAKKSKMDIVLWNIMPYDFRGWSAEKISSYILKRIRPGSIIVLHDGPKNREESVKALSMIIDGARAEGYTFLSLTEARSLEAENT
jgi:peptidoglycan/xylan/chitin deacetylase (PgdA/CDA1 family)